MTDLGAPDPGFTTATMSGLWSPTTRVQRLLEVEVALAEAAMHAGVVPEQALDRIRAAAREPVPDAVALLREGWEVGTPVVALVAWLRERVGAEAAPHVHFGATSQDILDTALVLQLRASFRELERSLGELADALGAAIDRHPAAWVMGRTLLQPALPMKLQVRVAHWLDPVLTQLEALQAAAAALPIQLGGPVGDLASFGSAGEPIAHHFARLLGLGVPALPWHADRAIVVDAVNLATAIARACGTVANNLALLAQPELAAVQLDAVSAGRSSSMPDKRNPHHAARALAAARACFGTATIVTAAHPHELERAAGSWQAEWFAVPLVMQTAAATVAATLAALRGASFDSLPAGVDVGAPGRPDAAQLVERIQHRHRTLRGRSSP